jgi:tetratricopeptide (TPR) repeat protein
MEGHALLYTPQRLFGEIGSSPNALTHEPFLERARLQREQERDGSARLALGAYVVARLVDKLLALENDDELLEGFRWQLEAVRRHINELPPEAPETAHLAGVVAAVPDDGKATSGLWMSLTAYAYFLEHEGRLEEALELLTLAARSQGPETAPPDFVVYALLAGRLNRLLARWDVANECYQAAEEAASSISDLTRALKARLGQAHVLRGQGNLPQARAEVAQVISRAAASELADIQGDAQQDLGVILMLQGLRSESLEATYKAFRLAQDPMSRMRILGDLGYGLSESGYYDAARLALEIVVSSNASHLVKVNSLLELMQLESAVGNRVSFERRRNEAKELVERMAPSTAVDYRYKTAVGLARFDQVERARQVLAEALGIAEKHRLNEWYFRLERMLDGLGTGPKLAENIKAPAEAPSTPAVQEMALGLREYASLAAV